jgi:hypothetical protein
VRRGVRIYRKECVVCCGDDLPADCDSSLRLKQDNGSPGADCARGIQIKHGDGEGKEGVGREEMERETEV